MDVTIIVGIEIPDGLLCLGLFVLAIMFLGGLAAAGGAPRGRRYR